MIDGGEESKTKNRVYRDSQCLIDAIAINKAIESLSKEMNEELKNSNPLVLIVMTGGVVFAGQILPLLNFSLEVDFCQVSRYKTGTQGAALQWIVEPRVELTGRTLVLLDDIYDEGTTLLELIQACKNRGAQSVKTCVLVNKIHDRKQDPLFKLDYVALELPDRFLVGYGMDFEGFGRNLPGIFAID